jgi:hypothetical protein
MTLKISPLTNSCFILYVFEVEGVVFVVVGLDGVEVEEDVVELLQKEKACGHALATRNGVALTCRAANKLEEKKMIKFGVIQIIRDTLEVGFDRVSHSLAKPPTSLKKEIRSN